MIQRIIFFGTILLKFVKLAKAVDTGVGATFDVNYLADKKLLQFNATLPVNTWLGLSFGSGMINVDMVQFVAGNSTNTSSINDLWSTGFRQPSVDTSNDFTNQTITQLPNSTNINFVAYRALNTSDP